MKEELVAGAHGVEGRYPFLDVDVVQEFLYLSAAVKNSEYKRPIADLLREHTFPNTWKQKIGFKASANLQQTRAPPSAELPPPTVQSHLEMDLTGHRRGDGYCSPTKEGDAGDCSGGMQGSWVASDLGVTSLEQCAALCARCARCHYVSFSGVCALGLDPHVNHHTPESCLLRSPLPLASLSLSPPLPPSLLRLSLSLSPPIGAQAADDCSWYRTCNLDELHTGGLPRHLRGTFFSVRVAEKARPLGVGSASVWWQQLHAQVKREGTAQLASAVGGMCGYTWRHGDCEREDFGSWSGVRHLAGCRRRCLSCARCAYVSYSASTNDCSWFSNTSCDLADPRRPPPGMSYVSLHVAAAPMLGTVLPPPTIAKHRRSSLSDGGSSNEMQADGNKSAYRIGILTVAVPVRSLCPRAVVSGSPSALGSATLRVVRPSASGRLR